jgi:PEGA domain
MANKATSHIQVAILLLGLTILCTGCVRRRLTVRTNPPNAMVYVDHQPLGRSPVSHSFTYYGTRHFEIVRDGYRTEKFLRKFNPPWYQYPPLDFVFENLWPFEKRDERIVDVQMVPDEPIATETLIQSGENLRLQAGQGIAVNPLLQNINGNQVPVTIAPSPWDSTPTTTQDPYSVSVTPNSTWNPGQILSDVLTPRGEQTSGIPSVTPGGSFRPPVPDTSPPPR